MKLVRTAAALLLALGVAGCATASSSGADDPFQGAVGDQEIRIEVQNHNFSDATVWALVQAGRRIRLGTVRGKSDSVFTIPWEFSLDLQLEIDMVAGPRCTTRGIPVDPGDALQLRIEPVFTETSLCR